MQVLIGDEFLPDVKDGLEALGLRVTYKPELRTDRLPAHMADIHILIVADTRVSRRTIEAGPMLALILRRDDDSVIDTFGNIDFTRRVLRFADWLYETRSGDSAAADVLETLQAVLRRRNVLGSVRRMIELRRMRYLGLESPEEASEKAEPQQEG